LLPSAPARSDFWNIKRELHPSDAAPFAMLLLVFGHGQLPFRAHRQRFTTATNSAAVFKRAGRVLQAEKIKTELIQLQSTIFAKPIDINGCLWFNILRFEVYYF
jgi:hypothetical protein